MLDAHQYYPDLIDWTNKQVFEVTVAGNRKDEVGRCGSGIGKFV